MKQKYMKSLVFVILFLCAIAANAYDFEKDGIYFNITSSEAPYTVEVTYSGTMPDGWSTIDELNDFGTVIYNLQGQRIANPQRGQIVIVRYSDGTSKKVLLK